MESLARLAEAVPDLIIEVPNRRNWYRLRLEELPQKLAEEIRNWLAHDQGLDMRVRRARSKDTGRRSRRLIKARTADTYMVLILEFITMEVRGGVPLETLCSLKDVVALDNVDRGLVAFEEHFRGEKRPHLGQVMRIVCLVARHWVGVDQGHDSKLWEWTADVSVRRHVMTDKNKNTILALRDKGSLGRLLALCHRVISEILAKPRLTWRDAVRAQVAFAIALLLNAPARIGNIAGIDLDENIRRVGTGADEKVFLFFPGNAVKNEEDLLYPLSPRTRDQLNLYLAKIRPLLVREVGSRWLFPGEERGHKGFSLLSQQIAALTEEVVGVRVTAHQFRHITATILLARYGLLAASKLLGHRSTATTSQNYAWLDREDVLKA